MTFFPFRQVAARKVMGVACASVLCGILATGLAPFHKPRNAVTWLTDANGVRFGRYGEILSPGPFQVSGARHEDASSSIELWLQPDRAVGSSTILSFSTRDNPDRFTIQQYFSSLLLKRAMRDQPVAAVIGVQGVFHQQKSVFLSVASGPKETKIYVNATLAGRFPGYAIGEDCEGQLVVGGSSVESNSWRGRLRGLAFYDQELTLEEVRRHWTSWTEQGRPALSASERITALYLFAEHAGNVVRNSSGSGSDLYIPERYALLYKRFLQPFWEEYRPFRKNVNSIAENIIGFVPLGFLFYVYWSLVRPIKRALITTAVLGFSVSLAIEVLQYWLPTRHSGTMDLITNTLGSVLGAGLYHTSAARSILAAIGLAPSTPEPRTLADETDVPALTGN